MTAATRAACLMLAALIAAPAPAQPPAPAPDKAAVARRLDELAKAGARGEDADPWGVVGDLTRLPGDAGFELLRDAWPKLAGLDTRTQAIKAWYNAPPYPLRARNHPRLLAVLDLGMRDPSPEVQNFALTYLRIVSFRDFAKDFPAYEAWYEANRGKTPGQVVAESVRRFAAECAALSVKEVLERRPTLRHMHGVFPDVPEARRAALDSGLPDTLARWAGEPRGRDGNLAVLALGSVKAIKPDAEYLKRVVAPLLAATEPTAVRVRACEVLGDKANAWALKPILAVMADLDPRAAADGPGAVQDVADAVAAIGDPRAIPAMIALIDADDTPATIGGVGSGLVRLTGVPFSEGHNARWWRDWWELNKDRYPGAAQAADPRRAVGGPKPELGVQAPADADAEDDGAPALDLKAGGDAMKRYFLTGLREGAKPPPGGYSLLIVLTGGDGGADFRPFVGRIHSNVLSEKWLLAQPVAPVWDAEQQAQVVWPTEGSKYPAAKFTTEEFLDAVLADVKSKASIDPKRVYLLGWSSSGPACYAYALRKDTPVAGAFVAMSVFKPAQLPPPENAKGRAFFLLQSPGDKVTPVRFAEEAEKTLRAGGAAVRLRRYDGGHGWRGDVWGLLAEGVGFLEKPDGAKP